jgi:endonuclease YncB( thermonuclease family)
VTRTLAFACALLASSAAFALETLEGRVVRVVDGDGVIVLVGEERLNVRLADIDAPELRQAYGVASRQSLAALCGGELAKLEPRSRDRNRRVVGRVTCGGVDAGAEQVRRGMAWVFERYAPAGSPLYAVQMGARGASRGLWAGPEPMPPWAWRAARR